MGKVELAEVVFEGETKLTPATQYDTVETETRSSLLGKVHRFVKGLIIPLNPPPPKESIDDADYIPEMTAGWFSLLTFGWMNSLMTLGYARPLEASDLWKLQEHRSSEVIANDYSRLIRGSPQEPPLRLRLMSALRGDGEERLRKWVEKDGKKQPSLTLAINDSIKWWFWSGGILMVAGDTAQVTSPLILKSLIRFSTDSYVAHREGLPAPGVGRGIALGIALVILQLFNAFCQHHAFYRTTSSGVLIRGGLITAIYSRSLRLTTGSRARLSNGRLINHISTDVSRIDFCCGFFHMSWTAPVQLGICLGLLISNLGPSALAGFAVFVILAPIQGKIYVRTLLLVRAANIAMFISTPALASVVAFLVYAGSGHQLTPAVIFSSLTWFQLLRLPLMMLPLSLSTIADARNAIGRLQECFTAELISETLVQDPNLKYAVEIDNASFTWDGPPPDLKESKEDKGKKKSPSDPHLEPVSESEPKEVKEEVLFKLKNIDLRVPRGQLVAIVGAVGSGKTSLLQGLIGDMRRTEGSVRVGGSVAYCSQSAWIQNATIRDNICFGRPFEAERYWKVVHDACLEPDLDVLPNGDMTEVGYLTFLAARKQRVNICRAIYSRSDILIFDDPLSALDAHVESPSSIMCSWTAVPALRGYLLRMRFISLPKVDHIYFIVDGRITEHGTFDEMMANREDFARTFNEFVTKDQTESKGGKVVDIEDADADEDIEKRQAARRGAQLMQAEERNTGVVSFQVYKQYIQSGNGTVLVPVMLVTLVVMQVSIVLSSYWCCGGKNANGDARLYYMGIYAALGVGQALATFLNGIAVAFIAYSASRRMHNNAITRVMLGPMSFFETTPVGRIMNRFSKDIDTIDNVLVDSFRSLINTISSIIGAIVLISILLPWFLIVIAVVSVLYAMASAFYRASAREMKRLDAILRSSLYSHFSETLSGIATIRAYREEDRFVKENRDRVNIENRAYWMTVTNQRWLGIRLDFLGTLLTLVVAMLTVGTRFSISPAQTGVTLSYILTIQQTFTWMIRQLAEVENDMNSVERILYYARDLEQEPPHEIPDQKPPAPWPSNGKLEIHEAFLNMSVEGGEKIGIVGRTGAGKSSIMVALFRMVELVSGSISIDGVDISKLGLNDVRKAISIIPQDSTLRSYLVEETKRISAVKPELDGEEEQLGTGATTPNAPRFTLDSTIEEEGSNLSVGQRSLVSLARALVKDSKILILDEATASVDYETDRKIQETIANEFRDRTILCIAHRLRTIISYDRICVLDDGKIVEFDDAARGSICTGRTFPRDVRALEYHPGRHTWCSKGAGGWQLGFFVRHPASSLIIHLPR
ncbi:ABC transporter [Lactarius psammicola]|nr:ABC transporter [Lactarius psammicola]